MLALLAVWVIVMSALQLKAAMDFTGDKVTTRWAAAILALLAIVGGSMVLVAPNLPALSVVLNVGIVAITNGVALIALDARSARAKTADVDSATPATDAGDAYLAA
jgi:uncharacterized membrane protein HdeD (DUF308 family)